MTIHDKAGIRIALGAAAAILFGSGAFASVPTPKAVTHSLYATVLNTNSTTIDAPANTWKSLDPISTVSCTNAAGCTIELQATLNLYANAAVAGNWIVISGQVDSAAMHGANYYQGEMAPDGAPTTITSDQVLAVPYGTHIIQSQIYATYATQVETYELVYRIYKP